MTTMPPLRNILNDTPATAVDVDWNFQTVEDYIATDLIHRDGSVAMEAPLNLLGPAPSQPTHAITKGYVDTQIIPIGTIWQFAGTVAPAGWAFCDFSEHSSTDPAWVPLFNVISFTYGQNGSNFRLPDLQGRVSFPSKGGPLPPELRAYTKDRAMRYDLDEDLLADDGEDDSADGEEAAEESTADIEYYEEGESSSNE